MPGDSILSGKVVLSYLIDPKDTPHRTLSDFFDGAISAPGAYELTLRSSIDLNINFLNLI